MGWMDGKLCLRLPVLSSPHPPANFDPLENLKRNEGRYIFDRIIYAPSRLSLPYPEINKYG